MKFKSVKDFEFPPDKGFSGSAGVQTVKQHTRSSKAALPSRPPEVKKARGGATSLPSGFKQSPPKRVPSYSHEPLVASAVAPRAGQLFSKVGAISSLAKRRS